MELRSIDEQGPIAHATLEAMRTSLNTPDKHLTEVLSPEDAVWQLRSVCMLVNLPWRFYDRACAPIGPRQAFELYRQMQYRVLAHTIVAGWRISTVWLAVDHASGANPSPLLFETIAFRGSRGRSRDRNPRRYSTELEALTGHAEECERIKHEMEEAMRDVQ